MPKDLFISDKSYTFQEAADLLGRAILSINDKNENMVFSIVDLLYLLRSVNAHVPGEFEIQRTHSHYYKVVYKSKDKVIESFQERWKGFIA